jgi:hypothetical protein
MATPQDQPATTNTSHSQSQTSKRSFWLRLAITFVVSLLIVFLILTALTYLKVIPAAPTLTALGTAIAAIGTLLKATISDKDFQQAFTKWLTKRFSGGTDAKAAEDKAEKDTNAAPSTPVSALPNITVSPNITLSPTFTLGSSTNVSSPSSALAQSPLLITPSPADPSIQTLPDNPEIPKRVDKEPAQRAPSSQSDPIFFVNVAPPTAKEVYGRVLERMTLLTHTRKGGCVSIIGPRRIGKSWLVTYLRLVMPDELGAGFRLGYIDTTWPSCATEEGFIIAALKALDYPSFSLPEHPDLISLEHFVKDMVAKKQTPVLCVDEFERLTQRREFDLAFFTELRSITQSGLGMVVVSKDPLIDIASENLKTSPFFNVFVQLRLVPFNQEDAEQFAKEKSTQAGFTDQERAYLLKYAQMSNQQAWPPLRLQLVGELLLNDKRLSARTGNRYYRPEDPEYWIEFKERVQDMYQGMVKP